MSLTVDQKEYLKKYLGRRPGEKKKKKKSTKRTTIIDDNVDLDFKPNKKLEDDEDAPQIVAIIDDRPPSLRIDDAKNSLWKPISAADDDSNVSSNPPQLNKTVFKINKVDTSSKPYETLVDSKKKSEYALLRRTNDISPQRKRVRDLSPKRESSPKVICDDVSPPRRRRKEDPSGKRVEKLSPKRELSSQIVCDDMSPPRRRPKEDRDMSPPRRKYRRNNDRSPPRRNLKNEHKTNISPPRRHNRDVSPPRPSHKESSKGKMLETLDGRKAGLQNAKQLIEENKKLRKEEAEMFKQMPRHVSGENAAPIIRDKKTGRIRNLEEEAIKEREKQEEENKNKEKYSRWGKGLAQIENREQRIQEELSEMNKPLARYADDADLEKHLKEQEREGDPMLAYLRSKKRKTNAKKGVLEKPQFLGEFMPNRYGIRPGHRWDGVDRSNDYEKKWFEVQNEKRAQIEDCYKWMSEDM